MIEKIEKYLQMFTNSIHKKNMLLDGVTAVTTIVVILIACILIIENMDNRTDVISEITANETSALIDIEINETTALNETDFNETTNTTTERDIYELYNITRPGHHPMLVLFDYKIVFLGYDINQTILHPNETFEITYYWKALDKMANDYVVFVHFTDDDGNLYFQQDHLPPTHTSHWESGDVVIENYTIEVPEDNIEYINIGLGWYYPLSGERLNTYNSNDRATIGRLKIEQKTIHEL